MAEKTTIARPYALVVFVFAVLGLFLLCWLVVLLLAFEIVADERVAALIGNPRVSATQLAELIIAVAGAEFDGNAQNFVRLLVENDRLSVLPEIAELYEHYRAEAERTVEAHMVSAFPVDDAQKALVAALLT